MYQFDFLLGLNLNDIIENVHAFDFLNRNYYLMQELKKKNLVSQ